MTGRERGGWGSPWPCARDGRHFRCRRVAYGAAPTSPQVAKSATCAYWELIGLMATSGDVLPSAPTPLFLRYTVWEDTGYSRRINSFVDREAYGTLAWLVPSCTPVPPGDVADRHRHRIADPASAVHADVDALSRVPISHAAFIVAIGGPLPTPVGPLPRGVAAGSAEVFLRQWALSTLHLYRAAARCGGPLGPADAASPALAGAYRLGTGRGGRRTAQPVPGRGRDRRTLLRVLRRLPVPSLASPTVLGVTIFRCGNATPSAQYSSISSAASRSHSSPIARPRPWRGGSGSIRGRGDRA